MAMRCVHEVGRNSSRLALRLTVEDLGAGHRHHTHAFTELLRGVDRVLQIRNRWR